MLMLAKRIVGQQQTLVPPVLQAIWSNRLHKITLNQRHTCDMITLIDWRDVLFHAAELQASWQKVLLYM